jgi:type IV pilus assembly protein PilM
MLGFVQNWFGSTSSPIGIDFGTDNLRMAQVEPVDGEYHLAAAATADVPTHVRNDPAARVGFFAQGIRDLFSQANFRGRKVILSLPASFMYIQHVRLPRMDEEATKKALPWELRGKLPIDPSQALLRHIIAGEVFQDQDPKQEVIVMAARRDLVDQLLAAAAKARLDVVGMNTEPKAIIDCFSHVYRRKLDIESTTCYLDMGCNASRAIIARGQQIFFARVIPIGGEHFSRAVATNLKMTLEEAKVLRGKLAAELVADALPAEKQAVAPSAIETEEEPQIGQGLAILGAALAAAKKEERATTAIVPAAPAPLDQRQLVELACREPISKLVEELTFCRRYYESAFPNKPVDRVIFIGGEARHKSICQNIARELGIAAIIGDPLARTPRDDNGGAESGINRRFPQPVWAVAVGLSMGPTQVEAKK